MECVRLRQNREGAGRGPADASEPLPERLARGRKTDIQADREMRNVDTQLKSGCRNDAAQAAGPQRLFDREPVFGLIAAAIGLYEIVLRLRSQTLHALPRIEERDKAVRIGALDQLSLKVRDHSLRFCGSAGQMQQRPLMPRRSVLASVDDREIEAGQRTEVSGRIGDRRAGCDNRETAVPARLRPADCHRRLKPPQQEGGIAAEHGFETMRLIDDQKRQTRQESPRRLACQASHHPGMTDIRGRDDDPCALQRRSPVRYRHVARDAGDPVSRQSRLFEGPAPARILVRRQRLQGIEHQDCSLAVLLEPGDGGRLEYQRLPGGCPRRQHDVAAGCEGFEGKRLMAPELPPQQVVGKQPLADRPCPIAAGDRHGPFLARRDAKPFQQRKVPCFILERVQHAGHSGSNPVSVRQRSLTISPEKRQAGFRSGLSAGSAPGSEQHALVGWLRFDIGPAFVRFLPVRIFHRDRRRPGDRCNTACLGAPATPGSRTGARLPLPAVSRRRGASGIGQGRKPLPHAGQRGAGLCRFRQQRA